MTMANRERALLDKMSAILEGYDDRDYRKPIGTQILFLLRRGQIRINVKGYDFLETFDDPLDYLITVSQYENTYEKFCRNMGYNIRVALRNATKEIDSE